MYFEHAGCSLAQMFPTGPVEDPNSAACLMLYVPEIIRQALVHLKHMHGKVRRLLTGSFCMVMCAYRSATAQSEMFGSCSLSL